MNIGKVARNAKIWAILPAAILAFCVAATLLLALLIDPDDYRELIIKKAESSANIELQINGELSWSFFPSIGFEFNQVDIYTLDSPQKTKFVHVAQASASLKVWPLFSGRIEFDALVLKGLKVNLVRSPDGLGNWQSILSQPAKNTAKPNQPMDNSPRYKTSTVDSGFDLAITEIRIKDALLHIDDRTLDQKIDFKLHHLLATDINFENTFPIEGEFSISSQSPELSVDAKISSMMGISHGGYALYLKELAVDGVLTGKPLKGKTVPVRIRGDLSADHMTETFNIKSLALKVANFPIILKLSNRKEGSQFKYVGSLRIAKFNFREFADSVGLALPKFSNAQALTDLSMKANISGSTDRWVLNDFKFNIDDSTLLGQLGISSTPGWMPFWNLELNKLQLADYAIEQEQTEKQEQELSGQATGEVNENQDRDEEQRLPLEMLQSLKFNGDLKISQLGFGDMAVSNVRLKTKANHEGLRIESLHADLYDGTLTLNGLMSVEGDAMNIGINAAAQDVQVEPLLSAVTPVDILSGVGALEAKIKLSGKSVDQLINSVTGQGSYSLQNGELRDINLTEYVCKGLDKVSKNKTSKESWLPNSEFDQFGGTFRIDQGVFKSSDTVIALPSVNVSGAGWVDLFQKNMDYRLSLNVSGEQKLQGCNVSEKWRDFRWPVRCKGAFDDSPFSLCRLDSAEISRQVGDKIEADIKNKAKKQFKKSLKKLFEGH